MNHEFSIDGLFDFLNAGVSAFHSTAAAAAILEENGYQNCPESAAWQLAPGGKYYTTRHHGLADAQGPADRLARGGQPQRFAHLAGQETGLRRG